MKANYFFTFLLALSLHVGQAQSYKGIFAGINLSDNQNMPDVVGLHVGWHVGYAIRGDMKKKAVPQLEFLLSCEGYKTGVKNIHVVLVYAKAPILLNVKTSNKHNPFRLVLGMQPTYYMGGFAKEEERLYNLAYFLSNETSSQPGIGSHPGGNGKYTPRLWNVEGVAGFEVLGKHLNFGMRINAGVFENNRFRNTGLSIRFGF